MLWRIAFAGTLNQEHLKKALCHWVGKENIPRMENILNKNNPHNLLSEHFTQSSAVTINLSLKISPTSLHQPPVYTTWHISHNSTIPIIDSAVVFQAIHPVIWRFQPVSMSKNMVNTWLSIKSIRLPLTWQPLGKEIHMLWTQSEVVFVQLRAVTP